jgi:hypothetical protein
MKTIKLNENVQNKIVEYLTQRWNDLDTQNEIESLMNMISPSLKQIVTQHLFLNAIQSISVFNNTPELL